MHASELPTTPSFRLDGRQVLVTGAGRRMGVAVATAFAEPGEQVTLRATSTDPIESAGMARGRAPCNLVVKWSPEDRKRGPLLTIDPIVELVLALDLVLIEPLRHALSPAARAFVDNAVWSPYLPGG